MSQIFKQWKLIFSVLSFLLIFCHPFDFLNLEAHYPSSRIVLDKEGVVLRVTLTPDQQYRVWQKENKIPKLLIKTFLFKEDQQFYNHIGLNPYTFFKSIFQLLFKRRPDSGASTISMQLARLHFGLETGQVLGKIKQIFLALFLEATMSKQGILEAYLNLAPFGRNIQGVKAASRIYFKKELHELVPFEMAVLSNIPQTPGILNSHRQAGYLPGKLKEKTVRIYKALSLNFNEYKDLDILKRPYLISSIEDLPFKAPHFTDYILRVSQKTEVSTTLNYQIQETLEKSLKAYIERQKHTGLQNASLLLLNSQTMELVSMVGSADFFNDDISGQVNGVFAKRSPGSTLKPLIYGLALERGIINPLSMVFDAPLAFRTPENFDGTFKGPMSATDALITSRNVPAVFLTSELGEPSLFKVLKSLYPGDFSERNDYGTSLALGAKEFSLWDLCKLYSAFANAGQFNEPKVLMETAYIKGPQILKAPAVAMLLEMLSHHDRPGLNQYGNFLKKDFPIYWKTGTSFGFRDAWSIGVFGPYVLGVWVGNFDGSGNPNLIGSEAAAPLFFQTIDRLKNFLPSYVHDTRMTHNYLKEVSVCSLTGNFAGQHCPHQKKVSLWPGVSPLKKCRVHREVLIDRKSGLRSCLTNKRPYEKKIMEVWPSHILEVFKRGGLKRKTPPELHPLCSQQSLSQVGHDPLILTPHKGVEYTYREGTPSQNKIVFKATGDGATKRLHWFIEDRYLGATKNEEAFIWEGRPGTFRIRVLDDFGREDSRKLVVRYL